MPIPPTWLPDEPSRAGRENLDPDHAAAYDDKENAQAAAEVEVVLSSVGLTTPVVVDLGAGTGQFALAAAQAGAQVVAVDVSPVMLEQLRAKVAAIASVSVVEAGFLTYDHLGPAPHAIYSRYALHHLADVWKVMALQRMFDMLAPGSIVRLWDVAYDAEPSDVTSVLEAWARTLDGADDPAGWTRADIEEHIRDEHSTTTWLLDAMIDRVGFAVEHRDTPSPVDVRYLLRKPV